MIILIRSLVNAWGIAMEYWDFFLEGLLVVWYIMYNKYLHGYIATVLVVCCWDTTLGF